VVTPGGRGPDGFYQGFAEADTFEVWNDVARHYDLDPNVAAVSGYSMGGFGTYRLLARWPDLFESGFSVVGRPGTALDQLASLRNHRLLAWNAAGDELVQVTAAEEAHEELLAAGIRHEYWLFPPPTT
jgi:predicted peptidase